MPNCLDRRAGTSRITPNALAPIDASPLLPEGGIYGLREFLEPKAIVSD
jgi:hypothetical protein